MGKKKTRRQWLWEFIKKIVVAVTIIYVAAMIFSAAVICIYPDSTAIVTFIENVTKVFIVTVVGYAVKAGFENVAKIKNNPVIQEDYTGRGNDYGSDDV